MIETWLILPIVALILFFALSLALYIKKTLTLEKISWYRSITNQSALRTFNMKSQKTGRCLPEGLALGMPLPLGFKSLLLKNCGFNENLSTESTLSPIHSRAHRAGSDFRQNNLLKHLLWQQGMQEAGYGALPLELLGVEELAEAVGILKFDLLLKGAKK